MIAGTIIALVTALIVGLLGWIAKEIMTWFLGVYYSMFYSAMAVETLFYDVIDNGYFNLNGLYQAIYTFAIALLIMFFVKKLLETYMAWSNRRSRNITIFSTNRIFKSNNNNGLLWFHI